MAETNDRLLLAVCEDEAPERERILQAIEDDPHRCEVESFPDGETFLRQFFPGKYDLVLLDIYMGKTNGVQVAERIRKVDPNVPLAFVTTSLDHALDGYRLHVDRYLSKPVDPAQLSELIEYAKSKKANQPGITVRVDRRDVNLPYKRIRFMEQQNHSVVYHLTGGQNVVARGRISALAEVIPMPPFFRCHQSYIVNLEHVYNVNTELNVFEMDEGDVAYIRRDSVRQAKSAFVSFAMKATRGM